MARWKLTAAHYLNVPGTEWEQKETSRETGRQVRKVYPVPLHLDPDDRASQNRDGEVIVAHEGSDKKGDFVFLGDPTPDMEPLDEEAEALSEARRPFWLIKPDSGIGYGDQLVAAFEKQIQGLIAVGTAIPAAPLSANSVSRAEFDKLQEQMAALIARNAELEAEKPARRA